MKTQFKVGDYVIRLPDYITSQWLSFFPAYHGEVVLVVDRNNHNLTLKSPRGMIYDGWDVDKFEKYSKFKKYADRLNNANR